MIFRDAKGNVLNEGDSISFPLGLGQAVEGRLVKTELGLGGKNVQPMAHVVFTLPLGVQPNGVIGGVFKIVDPEAKPEAPRPQLVVTE